MKEVRDGDQQYPVKNEHPGIQDMVIADIEARKAEGIKRYGTVLQPHNGRDSLRDLYEELLDAAMYTRQLMEERQSWKMPLAIDMDGCCGEGCCGD